MENSACEAAELSKTTSPAPDSPESAFDRLKASETLAAQGAPEASAEPLLFAESASEPELPAALPELPPPSIWAMPHDALPETVEQSPYETAAGILERLHAIAPVLTGALIEVLGSCDKRQLMTLFGMAPNEVADDPEPVPPAEPERPVWHYGPQQVPDGGPSTWTYNARGERQQRLPSSFAYTRDSERPAVNSWRTR